MVNELPPGWQSPLPSAFQETFVFDEAWDTKTCVLPQLPAMKLLVKAGVFLYIFEMADSAQFNSQMTLELEPGASVFHVRLQVQPSHTTHQSSLSVKQAADSRFHSINISAGANVAELSTDVNQMGPAAQSVIEGLYLVQPQQRVTMNASVCHSVPRGYSRQLFKGILAEKAQAKFRGRIHISKDAQQVNSSQLSSALILGSQATVETLPELEIDADDVKAAHGATVGQLDPEEIFYLQTRGLHQTEAVRLLAHGFMAEIIQHIPDPTLQGYVLERLAAPLRQLEDQFVIRLEAE